jgi:hypothetical protein
LRQRGRDGNGLVSALQYISVSFDQMQAHLPHLHLACENGRRAPLAESQPDEWRRGAKEQHRDQNAEM